MRVVQPYNRTHLFMCGSGAYSPVCVYVNRGRRPEVGTPGQGVLVWSASQNIKVSKSLSYRSSFLKLATG